MMRGFGTILLSMAMVTAASADDLRHPIRVIGRKAATVTTAELRLSDLAEVSSDRHEDVEGVIALQKLVVDKAPAPGEEVVVTGARIVEKMREAGIDLASVGYLLPKSISVKRASRDIRLPEIRKAVESFLLTEQPDTVVKRIDPIPPVRVNPDQGEVAVKRLKSTRPGRLTLELAASNAAREETLFDVGVVTDEFGDVPVAKRSIPRGATIGPNDVLMARMNLSLLPRDAASTPESVVGFSTSQEVVSGEVFRQAKLEVPEVVKSGQKVVLRVRSGLLEATASGTALDGGGVGEQIRVRNDGSKKIVSGSVTAEGIVEVTP